MIDPVKNLNQIAEDYQRVQEKARLDIIEIQMMRRLARQAAKDLRPIEQFFYTINRPVPTSHPASPHYARLHPLTAKFLKSGELLRSNPR